MSVSLLLHRYAIVLFLLCVGLSSLAAQQFPTATEIAEEMTIGWNVGNTLEALYEFNGEIVAGETAWGNPVIQQRLIDSVKAAGFNTIRLPVAWDVHAQNDIIDPAWMNRVQEVVDMCYQSGLYVIVNIHWDMGWLEENVRVADQAEVNRKQGAYWGQIAEHFQDYDHHLLFASANEPHADNASQMAVLLSYHQTFIDVVRANGGSNAERTLIIQGPRTDIELTDDLLSTLPTDPARDKLMVEVHFYPYQFTLMTEDASWGNRFFYWGNCNRSATDPAHNPTWGEEAFVDEMFGNMKSKFIDQGIPVILGEYGARKRNNLTGERFRLHQRSREYYLKYVTHAAVRTGLVPFYWCAGLNDLFDRTDGSVREPADLAALMAGAYSTEDSVVCGERDCNGTLFGHAYRNSCQDCVTGGSLDCLTNTDNPAEQAAPALFPNPTTGPISIEYGDWVLYDHLGRVVLEGVNTPSADISEFPAGVYFVVTGGRVTKLIKR